MAAALGSVVGVRTSEPVFALTFDDGPHRANTARILPELAQGGARATFFVLVDNVAREPMLVKELMAAGHEIGLHGIDHVDLTSCSPRQVVARVRGAGHRLEQLIGRPVTLFRPPYGTQSWLSYAVARASGMEVVMWSSSPRDFLTIDWERQLALALEELAPGGVMLLHDGAPAAPERRGQVVRDVLAATARSGLTAVPVGELLERGPRLRRPWFIGRAEALREEFRPFYVKADNDPP
jgi:peptidoglycan/xylan/chitin deacetylase (PgdA/CDA1 family)